MRLPKRPHLHIGQFKSRNHWPLLQLSGVIRFARKTVGIDAQKTVRQMRRIRVGITCNKRLPDLCFQCAYGVLQVIGGMRRHPPS